jgi:hypothetical protein
VDKEDFLTFTELLSIIEDETLDKNFKKMADLLLEAITDWPFEAEPAEIIFQLKEDIKDILTYGNLNEYSKTLKIHKDAWKMEALTSLLEMFDIERNGRVNNTIGLDEIFSILTKNYRTNK